MQITERNEGDITIFSLEGRVDSQGSVQLESALQAAVEAGQHKIALDMAKVSYLNSAALRTLADIITQTREKGGDLRLASLVPKVQRVLHLVGFDKFSSIYETLDQALINF
ncbi:MAG: STAS domain-containing protein [Anaerolineae bacterium]|nr:STAS domain-containing protein [Anaerolineae bacterium]